MTGITVSDLTAGVVVNGSGIAVLVPGESDNASYSAFYTIQQSDIDNLSFINQASVEATDPNGIIVVDDSDDPLNTDNIDNNGDGEPDDPTVVSFDPSSSVTLLKIDTYEDSNGNSVADAGDIISYQICHYKYRNHYIIKSSSFRPWNDSDRYGDCPVGAWSF
uniref:DUF7507 domain-containing protein n=1 Tax=Nonlabens ponticola TaxID=2496866 RepID=UPI001F49CEA3|nr:hypothetical protein [Nonlabens ponticola]